MIDFFYSENVQNKLDLFFNSFSDFFVKTLKYGLYNVKEEEIDKINLNNESSKYILKKGYNYIQEGIDTEVIKILLETEICFISTNHNLKKDEILNLFLIKESLLCLQKKDYKKFLDIQNELCSNKFRGINESKFIIFDSLN